MITCGLLWFLIGVFSGAYIIFVDVSEGNPPFESGLGGLGLLILSGILMPAFVCGVCWVAYSITRKDYNNDLKGR